MRCFAPRLGRLVLLAVLATALSLNAVTPSFALTGSTFEGSDGNLVVNTAGNTDWANAPNRVVGIDLPSGPYDNGFGQGTKEDNTAVSVVTGTIPPNKSDLTRFYVANEFVNNSTFLYLAWERANVLGSANMDFEINQKATPGFTSAATGQATLNRTAGDLLITFDFTNGGNAALGLLRWVTSGSTSQCYSSNSLPCWGNHKDLSAAGFAEGAVNSATVTDTVNSSAPITLPARTFGEAAVNLTAAGVFTSTPGICETFGSAFLKSRSSASFNAEVKDFIAPQPAHISNCGTINVTEYGDASFGYTTTGSLSPATFTLSNAQTQTYTNVVPGSYSVTESTIPGDWTLTNLSCTATGTGNSASTSGATASITLAGGGTVDCTYTNTEPPGAIRITKTSSTSSAAPLQGATFDISTDAADKNTVATVTTDSTGTACKDNLPRGTYYVTETKAPTGYQIDTATAQSVNVNTAATCSDSPYEGQSISFTDTPLTDLAVTATGEVPNGTNSTITCVDSSNNSIGSSGANPTDPASVTAKGLKPGTYTCTVVVAKT